MPTGPASTLALTTVLVVLLSLLAPLALVPSAAAQKSVDDFRSKMEKWVETRRILSQEQADWALDRETLLATSELLEDQKRALEADIAELQASSTGADEERRDLLLERGEHQRSAAALESEIRAFEEAVLELSRQLPEPLQKKLEPLLVQIPREAGMKSVPLGQRLMSVLGVLAQAEKWNGTATFVGETRAVGGEGSPKVQVRTLYWGLGQALYVDARGEVAGVGRPGPEGWEFRDDPEMVEEAKLLLDIYEGNVDAIEFVAMPVEIR